MLNRMMRVEKSKMEKSKRWTNRRMEESAEKHFLTQKSKQTSSDIDANKHHELPAQTSPVTHIHLTTATQGGAETGARGGQTTRHTHATPSCGCGLAAALGGWVCRKFSQQLSEEPKLHSRRTWWQRTAST